jgi:hypothetical protein
MVKFFLLMVGLITLLVLLPAACSGATTGEVKAALNQEFRLSPGETASLAAEGLKIKFESVTADSRCPQGVTCIWAGEAKCQTTVTLNKTTVPLVLTVSGSSPSQTAVEGYTLSYNLTPYPQAQQTIEKSAYILVMKVIK